MRRSQFTLKRQKQLPIAIVTCLLLFVTWFALRFASPSITVPPTARVGQKFLVEGWYPGWHDDRYGIWYCRVGANKFAGMTTGADRWPTWQYHVYDWFTIDAPGEYEFYLNLDDDEVPFNHKARAVARISILP